MKLINNYNKLVADLVERTASQSCFDAGRDLKGKRYVTVDRSRTLAHPYNIQSTYTGRNKEQ